MKKTEFLNISESFYSVQGEGASSGVPSYFIRLANCNLQCSGMNNSTLQQIRKLVKEGKGAYDPEIIDLMIPQNGATWVCDTIPVWVKGERKSFGFIINDWKEKGIEEDIRSGFIHIVWSGGEPGLKNNQESIVSFLNLYDHYQFYNEIETNGTQFFSYDIFNKIQQINCSVKLSNSGHTKEQRIVPDALDRICAHNNYWFKFVVSDEKDMEEIMDDFIRPFYIPKQRVILMPALSKQDEFHEKTKFVFELAKKYRVRACQRLHVSAWDQLTGV